MTFGPLTFMMYLLSQQQYMYIDSHAHLTSDDLYLNVEEYIQRAKLAGVNQIVNICTDLRTLQRGVALSKSHPQIVNAGATTPHDVTLEGEIYFEHFEKAAYEKQLVAIGETGLDYYYEHSPKKLQQDFFIRYLKLATICNLPIIIHCRDAFADCIEIIDQYFPKKKQGVLHCFTGTLEDAKELVKRGWYISFSGIVTFKKSIELQEVACWVPMENLLIETDSPYLSPHPLRGKTNEPSFLPHVAAKIAEIKNISIDQVSQITTDNSRQLFKL